MEIVHGLDVVCRDSYVRANLLNSSLKNCGPLSGITLSGMVRRAN